MQRGPDCFSTGLNVSCRTETSAYTALYLDENGDGNSGWVQYDMHGIQFAMEFAIAPKRRDERASEEARWRSPM